ncbi:MAG TPA: translocation/assembly module TamB domain-containing protein [Terriglobales bacterium]|nr:translocation/assembly module TamB domain-containing protein [Terriglobales bacterium]
MDWKKPLRWMAAIVGVVVFAVGTYSMLRSTRFHHYVLAKIVEEGQNATGGKLEVQNWGLHFLPLRVDLYGIVLHGTEPADTGPLLQIQELTVGVDLRSLLQRKPRLTELLIQRPIANLIVQSDGKKNVPTPSPQHTNGSTNIWDLAVGHVLLSDGEISYNDAAIPLDADLYDLKTEIHFDSLATRYAGNLSYRRGRLQYAKYPSLAHNLDAQFSAMPSGITIESLLLTIGSSRIVVHGDIADYSSPTVNAAYQILVHPQDFAAMVPRVRLAGDIQVDGRLQYQHIPNQSLLHSASVDGRVKSSELQTVSADASLGVRGLKAQYRLANGDLDVHAITAEVANGYLAGELAIHRLDTTPAGKVRVSLQHVSLESTRKSIRYAEIRRMPLMGTANAEVDASWTGSVQNVRALAEVAVRAVVWNNARPTPVPVDGTVHLTYDGPKNVIALHQTVLHMPSTSVMLDGELSKRSNLRIHAMVGDLHQFSGLAAPLQPQEPLKWLAISGSATLSAVVQGPMLKPQVSGQLEAQNLQVHGSQWKVAQLRWRASPSQLNIEQGSLESARQGELTFTAQAQLKNWSYVPSDPIIASLSARRMSVVDLERLANVEYPVTGTLSADIAFHGSELRPAGHGSVQVMKGTAYDEPIRSLAAQFQGSDDKIQSRVDLTLPAGAGTADVAYTPATKAYRVALSVPGIVLQKLQSVQAKNLPLVGTLSASANGAGTIDDPQLDVVLQIPALQVRETAVTGMKAQVNVKSKQVNLLMTSNVTQAFVQAKATVDLVGNYNTQATIDTSKVPLDAFLAVYAPSVPADFHGETELHATIKGPLKDASHLEAHLTIPTLDGSYQSIQFANSGPIRADYANSVVVLGPADIRGTETSLRIQGSVPLQGAAPMNVMAEGTVNLRLLSLFISALKSSGSVGLDVHGSGTIRNPVLQGSMQVKDGELSTSQASVSLSKLNGTLDISNDKLQIKNLKGVVGGGQVTLGGSVAFSPTIAFNVALQGKSVRLLYPQGVRTLLDSNLTFTGNMQAASLSGRMLIDSLSFSPDFDLSGFTSQFNGISVPSSGQSFADNIKLVIAVQSTSNLAARSPTLSLEGTINLQVIGTASNPVAVGRLDLTSGELFFMNNRYQLQRGIVSFDNPNVTTPVLNVQATTTVEQYNLTLKLRGPFDRLTTNYVSDPGLPTADIISLLYRGQTTEEAAAAGTSTDSLLASQAASRVSGSIQQLAGISSLRIDPLIGGNNANPSARVALQQRVTRNFLFTFSTDVTQPGQETIQGDYRINKRWSVSVTRDEVGGIAVDTRYHTKF